MSIVPEPLYGAASMRMIDRRALELLAIPDAELMRRAGEDAFFALRASWPRARRIDVVCGPGNNGGDAYVLARAAADAGLSVRLFALADPATGVAREAAAGARAAGVTPRPWPPGGGEAGDVVVDGLLGIGVTREVEGSFREAIEWVNGRGVPVLALDVPSGLDADSGARHGCAVRADLTVTFIAHKPGLYTGAGPACTGRVRLADLGVPAQAAHGISPLAWRLGPGLPPARPRDGHKGSFGRVLVVGGDIGMPGAVRLAAEAACRMGAGLVTIATRCEHAALIAAARPELIVRGVEGSGELRTLAAASDVIAIGPGLGCGSWGQAMLREALDLQRPLIVDADALNLLARDPVQRDDWVLTPHPGEAARLLGCDSAEVQDDRLRAAAELVRRYAGVCVLKGAGTLIAAGEDAPRLCVDGGPALAVPGSGDVLTGAIAGLRAQGMTADGAARLGVWLHARAGDQCARREGARGIMAGELCGWLRVELNRLAERVR